MEDQLVIVESPAKAKTIEKFLGKDFLVKSSFGHIRDLSKKDLGIEIEHDFKPIYEVPTDKKKVVDELKKLSSKAKIVWLASDEDREGEAIAWHLAEVLKLKEEKIRRIVFHEITKDAILHSIENPRAIDHNLVNAQQARRILDRLVGFELSPLLWKKIKPSLSAGRVQSVAVRLIVEREREIMAFKSESYFKITGYFFESDKNVNVFKAELNKKFQASEEVRKFLERCKSAHFTIADTQVKPFKKSPPPPFTTSTLQQEASRKFGFSVSQTMTIAQHLYEAGHITYMRTDSTNLSDLALGVSKNVITGQFGDKYYKFRQYKTKIKGAQEAHEAIRPTFIDHENIEGNTNEKKLYSLIRKRTLASQMADAQLEKTVLTIDISGSEHKFIASGEVIKFDGFLKLYTESVEEDNEESGHILLPRLAVNQKIYFNTIEASQRFTHAPARYSEASLVKRLEELGIGRPSTYAPTISTIQARGYVLKEDRPGFTRKYEYIFLNDNVIKSELKTENSGSEKSKLFPTDIGMVVNDFLVNHFQNILDFNFTASVEKDFDEIAEGNVEWVKMIKKFYKNFHHQIVETTKTSERGLGERILGTEPASGQKVMVRIGKFGPMVQIGENDGNQKPRYAPLRKDQLIETITLEQALELFKLPREVGDFENEKIVAAIGRFGPYLKHNNKFYSLPKGNDPLTISADDAVKIIKDKRTTDKNKIIQDFSKNAGILVLNGRYGPYITMSKENYRIPKGTDPATLTVEMCQQIIEKQQQSGKSKTKAPFKKRKK